MAEATRFACGERRSRTGCSGLDRPNWRDSGPGSCVVTLVDVRVAELTERVREARFTREVIGPKVARPLAGWLSTTFADEAEDQPADEQTALEPTALDGVAQDHAASETSDGASSDELSSDEPSRGETASDVASEIDTRPKGFVAVVKAVIARIKDHNLVVVAAGIAVVRKQDHDQQNERTQRRCEQVDGRHGKNTKIS